MQSDSDTESEHECHTRSNDGVTDDLTRGLSLSTSTGEQITRNELLRDRDALSAVKQIKSVDLSICQVRPQPGARATFFHDRFIGFPRPRSPA